LSKLVAADYTVDFWCKADSPGSNVVLRFLDTKTNDPNDHPWRKDYTLNSTVFPFDGQWHFVQIPLKKFIDAGSWDNNAWFNATNSFDWKAVDHFQIVTETMAITGMKFWFDDIRINGNPITSIGDKMDSNEFKANVFPNPVTENTILQYVLPESGFVNVVIYNLSGQKLATLIDNRQVQGSHQVRLTAGSTGDSKLTEGVYICKITSSGHSVSLKLVVKN